MKRVSVVLTIFDLSPEIQGRTETVLETVMRGTRKDIVREAELFDVPQALKVFSRRLR